MTAPAPRAFVDTPQFKVMRAVMGAANPLVRRLLASPFAGPLGRGLVLIRLRGRRSGRTITTPVGYVRDGDRIVVVTSPAYRWWRNVVGGAPIEVRVDGAWRRGVARVLEPDDPAFTSAVALQVGRRGPGMLRAFGLPIGADGSLSADARALADERVRLVEIALEASRR